MVQPSAGMEIVYTLTATQPFNSKFTGQKVWVGVVQHGTRNVTLDGKQQQQQVNLVLNTSISTGKSKSLAQLCEVLKDVFQRFLNGAPVPNQELGKWGDVRFGGELHFVAENADSLRFDYAPTPPSGGNGFRFTRGDVEKFAALLAQ